MRAFEEADLKTIETAELKKRIDRGDHFRLVDARPAGAYRAGHLPGAVGLSPDDVRDAPDDLLPEKAETIVVYGADDGCAECATIVDALESLGYEDVVWYRGGAREWRDAGHSLEEGAG